jgi:Outer membrane protein Omp28
MKRRSHILYLLSFAFAFLLGACDEVNTSVNLKGTGGTLLDSNYVSAVGLPDQKMVVLEELTGVQCINCPIGHGTLAALKLSHPNRIASVALHTYLYSDPYSYSAVNLKSDKAEQLRNDLNAPSNKPAAFIDRRFFPGQTFITVTPLSWSSLIDSQLVQVPPVNIQLSNSFNAVTRELSVKVQMHFTSSVSDPLKYTVYLVEDGIVTAQGLPSGDIDTNYVHHDVMRDILTNTDGNNLNANNSAGRTYLEEFRVTIPHNYNADHCKIVAIVHKYGASKDVLQGAEKALY